jgi:outer membrane lipoprotein-sorting protein
MVATLSKAALAFACVIVLGAVPRSASIASTSDLIAAMQHRYAASWYKTATFVQKTSNFAADGTPTVSTWYEALVVPGSLRIDFTPETDGNGILFTAGQAFNFKDGKQTSARPYVHPLMLLGFDIYKLPPAEVVSQLTGLKFDLSKFRTDTWQNRAVFVVGADKDDLKAPQFWIDQQNLYFVRMIRPSGTNGEHTQETQFNKYVRLGGGWMSPEVVFKTDGRVTTTEEYSELRADVRLPDHLFDPAFWTSVHWR